MQDGTQNTNDTPGGDAAEDFGGPHLLPLPSSPLETWAFYFGEIVENRPREEAEAVLDVIGTACQDAATLIHERLSGHTGREPNGSEMVTALGMFSSSFAAAMADSLCTEHRHPSDVAARGEYLREILTAVVGAFMSAERGHVRDLTSRN